MGYWLRQGLMVVGVVLVCTGLLTLAGGAIEVVGGRHDAVGLLRYGVIATPLGIAAAWPALKRREDRPRRRPEP